MAVQLIGSNLNQYGGNGYFETDRSTWGFGDSTYINIIRSTVQKTEGLYSARCFNTWWTGTDFVTVGLLIGRFVPTIGKKYLCRIKAYVPSSRPIADNARIIRILNGVDGLTTLLEQTTRTIADCTDNFQLIETKFEVPVAIPWNYINVVVQLAGEPHTMTELGGFVYFDEFEIYEYIDVDEEPDPDPDPDPEPNPYDVDQVYFSRNPITLSKTAASGWESEINLRLWNDVHVEDVFESDDFESKLRFELPPNAEGQAIFYLNEAFRDVFTLTPPTQNESNILRLTDRIKRFKCFSTTLVEDETEPPGATDESLMNLVLWGGVSKEKFPGLNYFTEYVPANKKFLTWAPIQKEVDRTQEDYLLFWVYDQFAELKLNLKVYFDDATDQTEVVQTFTGSKYSELYQIPSGPANSGALLIDPTKNVTHYELTLLDQDDAVISEVRTYYIAQFRHPLTRFFMFLNSLGGFEVVKFTGVASTRVMISRQNIQKFLPHNYAAEDGEYEINTSTHEMASSFSSGFFKNIMPREWHEYMIDFLASKRIYDVTDGSRIPVIIQSSEHVTEDQNYEFFVRFEAKRAYNNHSFTPNQI